MKWVARERPRTDRIACPWPIRNFIDTEAEFLHIPASEVLEVAEREGARSDDAPGVRYTHRDGLCSFEVLMEEYALDAPTLALLARIVHGPTSPRTVMRSLSRADIRDRRGVLSARPRRPPPARALAPRLRRALRLA